MKIAQILVFPNSDPQKTINSCKDKVDDVFLGFLNCPILKQYKNYNCDKIDNVSLWRNKNLKEINLILYSNEEFLDEAVPDELSKSIIERDNYISKEFRIVTKNGYFINPIYEEYITKEKYSFIKSDIKRVSEEYYYDQEINSLFYKNPNLPQNVYWKCFLYFKDKNYVEFINLANKYLFLENNNMDTVSNLRLYLGTAYKILKDYNKAVSNIVGGIMIKPFMSEFWCLLGDIFYDLGEKRKSARMYKNAIIAGKHRNALDELPIIVEKYSSYPQNKLDKSLITAVT